MPPKRKKKTPKKRIPTIEGSSSASTKRTTTKALRTLLSPEPADQEEQENPLALPGDIPRESDSDASSMDPQGGAAPSKKRCRNIQRITRKLTDAEEVNVIEWIQANPCIFNKAHADYKNTKKRDQLFADKAETPGEGLTGPDLYKWYLGQRSTYTKLIKRPASGSGIVLLTARQQWVVDSLSFLKGHCTTIPVRKGVDLTAARKKRYGDAPSQDIPASEPAEDTASVLSTVSVNSDSDLIEEREALTQELRQLRQERTDAATVTTRQLTHLMRQMTPTLRDQFMTETLASALRFVELSRQQPFQQLPSVPAQQQQQPIRQDFMNPQRPMYQAQQQSAQYAQDRAMALQLAQQLNPPSTETERRHFFTTLQGCYPDFTGSSCPPPAPTYATLAVRRTPTATVTTDGILAGAAAAAGITSCSTTTVSPTVSTQPMASTPTTQPTDASPNIGSFMHMVQDDQTTSY